MDSKIDTALSLERRTQAEMFLLFKGICDAIDRGDELPRVKQEGGRYITRREGEEAREIRLGDNAETIDRKVRAFWYPPYSGATYKLNGKAYALVSEDILYSLP